MVHTATFRRLQGKTQVLLSGKYDFLQDAPNTLPGGGPDRAFDLPMVYARRQWGAAHGRFLHRSKSCGGDLLGPRLDSPTVRPRGREVGVRIDAGLRRLRR